MKKQIGGFTVVEVMIASLILAGVFFSILKLTNNNVRMIGVLEEAGRSADISMSSRVCIEDLWYEYLKGLTATESLNFGEDLHGCFTGSYDRALSFTGISLAQVLGSGSEKVVSENIYWSYFTTGALLSWSGIIVENYIDNGRFSEKFTYEIYEY